MYRNSCDKISDSESDHSNSALKRSGRALFEATIPFAHENISRSWSYLITTMLILACLLCLASLLPSYILKSCFSVLAGLVVVRGFILYHDYLHGAILRNSKIAKYIMYGYGLLLLAPPRSWKASHNFHHAHIGQLEHSAVGSFPTMSVEDWQKSSYWRRLQYKIVRHPLVLAAAFITVFLINICLLPIFSNLGKHWDSILSLLVSSLLIFTLWYGFGMEVLLFSYIVPLWIASAVGAYLFYVQHNADGIEILPAGDWTYYDASVLSSSFLKLGPLMNWFTGNIGYHHVHHLNSRIPFYRLPEAMKAIPELQNPATTSLNPLNILRSLQLKLWDQERGKLVAFHELQN